LVYAQINTVTTVTVLTWLQIVAVLGFNSAAIETVTKNLTKKFDKKFENTHKNLSFIFFKL
jgi:hypothetical protein